MKKRTWLQRAGSLALATLVSSCGGGGGSGWGLMGAPGAGPQSTESARLSWNAWLEPNDHAPYRKTLASLLPRQRTRLVLDLARIAYSAPNVAGRATGEEFGRRVRDALGRPEMPDRMKLTVLLLVDSAFFEADEGAKTLVVDLERLRGTPRPAERDSLEAQAATSSVGHVLFDLQTKRRTGMTAVGMSVWADGTPVDEIQLEVCVGEASSCSTPPRIASETQLGLAGWNPATSASSQPAAAIHLVELRPGRRLRGVLHVNGWDLDRFLTWELRHDADALADYLAATVAPLLNSAVDSGPAQLEDAGISILHLLFPPEEDALAAEKAFLETVGRHFHEHSEASDADPPSIYLRSLPHGDGAPVLFPLGLAAIQIAGKKEFLGFHFRLVQPLEIQSYRVYGKCIDTWKVARFTKDGEIRDAWKALEGNAFWDGVSGSAFETVGDFRSWISDASANPDPALLVLVSHHDRNRLWFDDDHRIASVEFRRPFGAPSVAILDGCGTGAIGATDLIRTLNERGVDAAVTTQTRVSGRMAGEFLKCLGAEAADGSKPAMDLSRAHFRALNCLSGVAPVSGHEYGPRALTYALLGNGTIPLCKPKEIR